MKDNYFFLWRIPLKGGCGYFGGDFCGDTGGDYFDKMYVMVKRLMLMNVGL